MGKIVHNKTSRLITTSALAIYIFYTLVVLTCVECKRHHRSRSTTEPSSSSDERHHHNRRHHGHGSRRNSNKICVESWEDVERIKELRSGFGCKCPQIHAPVCGSNGITYHNRCYLECASEATFHRFRLRPITLEKWGPCEETMRSIERSSERTSSSSSFTTNQPDFGLHFWEKECPYINKRNNCTARVKSFCSEDFPQVISPGPGISLGVDGK